MKIQRQGIAAVLISTLLALSAGPVFGLGKAATAFAQTTLSTHEAPASAPAFDVTPIEANGDIFTDTDPSKAASDPAPGDPPGKPKPPASPPSGEEPAPPGGSPTPGGTPSPGGPDTPIAPPFNTVQPVPAGYDVKPEVDQSTGALSYRYPLILPPGRGGMTPELSLVYSSQNRRDGSPVGYGWNLSLPMIERQNLTGIQNLFTDEHFTSSLSGELMRVLTGDQTGNFSARIDDGSFLRYTFSANAWIASTKEGTRYFFGTTLASRLVESGGNQNNVARWFLDRIEDKNGNRISFTYVRDLNQLYLDTVSYTDTIAGAGPFLVTFIRELRPEADRHVSFEHAMRVDTQYRVSEVRISVSGALTRTYLLGYTPSAASSRSLLTSVAQVGYGSSGQPTTLPPTSFSYTPESTWFVPITPTPFAGFELRRGYLLAAVNSVGYRALVLSYQQGSNPGYNRQHA